MSCGGEITAVDRAPEGAGANGAYGDAANLYKHIARDQVFGLNLDPPESAKEAIKPWSERNSTEVWVESGVDDQMIITVPFTCPVRLQSILLNPGTGDFAPRRCTVFVNRPHGIDFEQAAAEMDERPGTRLGAANTARPQADFALLEHTPGVTAYPVSVSRFSQTQSVSLLLSDSPTQHTSRVFYIGFVGKALELRQDTVYKHDVAAENASSHAVDGVADKYGASSTPSVR
ncbi:uncharacterized protein MJAP1_003326 [Malassezia japonica]|uniref:PITH domain-containing protein n=1 Tax=Malassezia japonica TaxID=223818 RepID=A0AAF0F3X0_9BASI|nr:uncharacterized protein MJAP1_003326 [Malassezia japonica]WFD40340.1 hypothetical protein MJAP1_003326 [Malassezia japonica]